MAGHAAKRDDVFRLVRALGRVLRAAAAVARDAGVSLDRVAARSLMEVRCEESMKAEEQA